MKMEDTIFVVVYILMLQQTSGEVLMCIDGSVCPPDEQFCTSVGCVRECPVGSFINGSSCVLHCGTGFVLENTCVPSCPQTSSLTLEKVIVNGGAFHRIQVCVESCETQELHLFQYQDSCLSKCPPNALFVTNNVCSTGCQDGYKHVADKGEHNGQKLVYCLQHCPSDKPYLKDDTCVPICGENQAILGVNCVQNCPNDSYIINERNGRKCVADCPYHGMLYDDNRCVSSCPEEKKYITENVCVAECPPEAPLAVNVAIKSPFLSCVSVCPGNTFLLNFTCTRSCPKYYYRNTCIDECPNSTVKNDWVCLTKCPNNRKYVMNNACQVSCPQFYISNRTCVDNCPDYAKYNYGKECFEKCPSGLHTLNNQCVSICPHVTYNGSCLSRCPPDAHFIDLGRCVAVCSDRHYVGDGDRCVSTCGLRDNISCVHECPATRPNNKNGECVKSCGSDMLIKNKTCISSYDCSDKIVFEGQCLELCPVGSVYAGDNSCKTRTYLIAACIIFIVYILAFCIVCAVFFKAKPSKCWRKSPRTLSVQMEDETALLPS